MKGSSSGRSGPNTIVCGECGGTLEYDYLDELWRHVDNGEEECLDTGGNTDYDYESRT